MPVKSITVLLVEDHRDIREGLIARLHAEPDIEIVGEAVNGQQAVSLASSLCPDVIVMDISLPLMNGFEATRQILKTTSNARILVLSAHGDDVYVKEMRAIGAAGFLVKQSATDLLPHAIRAVFRRESAFFQLPPPTTN